MPPQINRLVVLTLAIVGAYFAARAVLRPKSFGEYGWYRGDSLRELTALTVTYAGKAACADCHGELVEKMSQSKHRSIACESCHGANGEHAESPAITPKKITPPQFCLRCHQANPARPDKFPQVDKAEHFGEDKCTDCHQPHSPTDAPKK